MVLASCNELDPFPEEVLDELGFEDVFRLPVTQLSLTAIAKGVQGTIGSQDH